MAANHHSTPIVLLSAVLLAGLFSASTAATEPPRPDPATLPPPEPGTAFLMQAPLDCNVAGGCFIQNYVDVDSGPEFRDYTCGSLGYNGHKGVDFALRDLAAMRRGVPVLAPAFGRVLRMRDNMPDGTYSRDNPQTVAKRECGNGLVIYHWDGWETQLCHLRQGSLTVRPGERVAAGQPIGLVGQSGRAEFPHVHVTVKRAGTIVDPFTGLDRSNPCGMDGESLWKPGTLAAFEYRSTEIIRQGFASKRPTKSEITDGRHGAAALSSGAGALYYWVMIKGLKGGDVIAMKIKNAAGKTVAKRRYRPLDRDKARVFVRVGGKPRSGRMRPGVYLGELEVIRDSADGGSVAFRSDTRITVR